MLVLCDISLLLTAMVTKVMVAVVAAQVPLPVLLSARRSRLTHVSSSKDWK